MGGELSRRNSCFDIFQLGGRCFWLRLPPFTFSFTFRPYIGVVCTWSLFSDMLLFYPLLRPYFLK